MYNNVPSEDLILSLQLIDCRITELEEDLEKLLSEEHLIKKALRDRGEEI